MKTHRVTKKATADRARFTAIIEAFLAQAGAVADETERENSYRYKLVTKFGVLLLHIDQFISSSGGPGTIFTRFDDPKLAIAAGVGQSCFPDINPHSGKWNHHYFSCWTIESAVKEFVRQINRVLISPVVFDPETVALPGRGRNKPKQENAEPCLSKST